MSLNVMFMGIVLHKLRLLTNYIWYEKELIIFISYIGKQVLKKQHKESIS